MSELEVVGMTTVEERLRRAARTHRILGNHTAEGLYLEAADTICRLQAENDKLRGKDHAYAYEAGYSDGATHYELEHCPACKNVADLQEALDENARLRELLMMAYKAATEPDCDECYNEHSCRNNELSYCVMWVELEQKMRDELGIEVY